MGKKRKKHQGNRMIEFSIRFNRKYIERLVIAALICSNLTSDNTLLSEKPHLGDIAKNEVECESVGSLNDTDNKG